MSTLKWAYLHNNWSKSHDQGTIGKLRSNTSHDPANPKRDSHTVRHHITNNHKLPNIATVFEPTVSRGQAQHCLQKWHQVLLAGYVIDLTNEDSSDNDKEL